MKKNYVCLEKIILKLILNNKYLNKILERTMKEDYYNKVKETTENLPNF